MLLHVADYNPNAIAFYTRYGFAVSPDVYKHGERGRHVLMYMPVKAELGAGVEDGSSSSSSASSAGSGSVSNRGFGADRKKSKAGKRRALSESRPPVWGCCCTQPSAACQLPARYGGKGIEFGMGVGLGSVAWSGYGLRIMTVLAAAAGKGWQSGGAAGGSALASVWRTGQTELHVGGSYARFIGTTVGCGWVVATVVQSRISRSRVRVARGLAGLR